MAEVDEKVMKFVEDTLRRSPKIQLSELFERAKKVSGSVEKLSKREFNARYPLQVKRRKAQAARSKSKEAAKPSPRPAVRRGRRRKTPEGARDAVRGVLLKFAADLAAAEERKDLVQVLAGVDEYVDQVLKGVAKA